MPIELPKEARALAIVSIERLSACIQAQPPGTATITA